MSPNCDRRSALEVGCTSAWPCGKGDGRHPPGIIHLVHEQRTARGVQRRRDRDSHHHHGPRTEDSGGLRSSRRSHRWSPSSSPTSSASSSSASTGTTITTCSMRPIGSTARSSGRICTSCSGCRSFRSVTAWMGADIVGADAHRRLWRRVDDGRGRVLHSVEHDCQAARSEFNARDRRGKRREGQGRPWCCTPWRFHSRS